MVYYTISSGFAKGERKMGISKKFVKTQLVRFAPLAKSVSMEQSRRWQTRIGAIMSAKTRKRVSFEDESIGALSCSTAIPRETRKEGIVLYIHGGGYCCGDLTYAKGFAATLADRCGVKVYTFGYRLAPEFPFPAALDDAVTAYLRLLERGYMGKEIVLCGERAAGLFTHFA